MITLLLAAWLQDPSALPETTDPAAEAELAEHMEEMQDWLAETAGTLESVAADFEAASDDDPAGMAAAWSRALTVNARMLSWYRVEDPIDLAARLALEFDALRQQIEIAPDGVGASYSIGYDFRTDGQTHTGPDGEPIDPPETSTDAGSGGDNTDQPYCPNGEVTSGERDTPRGPVSWRTCHEWDDEDGYAYIGGIQFLAGDEDNGSLAMVAIAVVSDDAGIRDAMAEPAGRIVDIMGNALSVAPENE